MSRIQELNAEIERLRAERDQILTESHREKEEAVKNLNWVKECTGRLEISPFLGAAGIPWYTIKMFGECPPAHKPLIVMKSEEPISIFDNNMLFTSKSYHYEGPQFYTSSEKTLFKFLDEVVFYKFLYNEKDFRVLQAAKLKSEACNGHS